MAKRKNILSVTVIAILIALGLSFVKIFTWPFGTSVTLLSMVPLLVIGYKYGVKWGLFSGLMFGVVKGLLDALVFNTMSGFTATQFAVVFVADYVVANFVLGFSGLFRDRINSDSAAITLGGAFAVILNYAAHFVSRFIIYGGEAHKYFDEMTNSFKGSFLEGTSIANMLTTLSENVIAHHTGNYRGEIYSFIYTSTYMIPELVLTLVCVLILMAIPRVNYFISNE
ncbi:MAG: hypothetical protein E7571_07050 [Ruminococcaceae bacterium]|nr:hypothetical protein [Oscillospiraceae bacterium]